MNDDYFSSVEMQLRTLCEQRVARRRRWLPRLPRRLPLGLGIAASLVVTVTVVLFALSGAGAGSRAPHSPATRPVRPQVPAGSWTRYAPLPRTLGHPALFAALRGLPQSGTTIGYLGAPVTITVWGDLECPICRLSLLSPAFRELLNRDVRSGQAKISYRSLCTATCNGPDPQVFGAQQAAAYAAGEQHRFWNYAFTFLIQQGPEGSSYVTPSYLSYVAREVSGLNITRWQHGRRSPGLLAQVRGDEKAASSANVEATPTLVFHGPAGTRQQVGGVQSYATLQHLLDQVRAR